MLVASQIVVSLQSLVSRSIDPLEAGIVTVGAIHCGTKHNIIGDRVDLQLTVRADNYETRATLLQGRARGLRRRVFDRPQAAPGQLKTIQRLLQRA